MKTVSSTLIIMVIKINFMIKKLKNIKNITTKLLTKIIVFGIYPKKNNNIFKIQINKMTLEIIK